MATLADKVRFLADPASYDARPDTVLPIETHMSWVFLAGGRVLKFKKPVHFPFLNLTRLKDRRANCEAEFTLNQRLAAGIYRGILPLTESADGRLAIGGDGRPVEWLVEMVRLPEAEMLDVRLVLGKVARAEIQAVGAKLARFYLDNPASQADGTLYLEHLEEAQTINRRLLMHPRLGLADPHTLDLIEAVSRLYAEVRPEIEARNSQGRLVEGHGDLKPEHVCLSDPPLIIDRLEFDRSMRILDPYDEINYLGFECQLEGAGWIRPLLLETLAAELGAPPSPRLMAFYGSFRALLRARLTIAHLLDAEPATPEIWPQKARTYLDLARQELGTLPH